ncbi:MAG: DUF3825 domain-containing protein [Paludibacteraceae bacterium]|nr:DUF3825 domain-containing protein [Paludibacteraceae bacterium]
MKLFDYAWFSDYHNSIEELKNLAMNEDWDYKKKPLGKNPILENYIKHTFVKLSEEHKILEQNGYSIFNTGLVTDYQEEIYALFQANRRPGSIKWYFIGWRKASDRDLVKFTSLPENANYFDNSSDLIYDTNLELRLNINHIIDDNLLRFPPSLQTMDKYQLGVLLQGTIEDAKKRIRRNYKTAVPQYYGGRLQLLLPLCLTSKANADLALVIEKENGVYRASTCLTLDMAINNARLIAKPDDEWLKI